MNIHFEMITVIKLINVCITSLITPSELPLLFFFFSLYGEHAYNRPIGKFQVYSTVLLSIVTMLYLTSSELTHLT